MANNDQPVVRMSSVTKRFLDVTANKDVSFSLYPGEICALLGENGAGKTTLMNILFGYYTCDEGEIFIKGEKAELSSPKDAISRGVGMIHQHFMLVETLTVAENVALVTLLSTMMLLAELDESNVGQVKIGQPAKIHVPAFWEEEFDGVVQNIALTHRMSNTGAKYYKTEILIQGDVSKLRSGLTADVDYDFVEVFARQMVPDSQFPDSAESVYTQL